MKTTIFLYLSIGVIILIAAFAILKIKATLSLLYEIANDTLKRPDETGKLKWSRTSMTMLTAWVVSIYMALYDMVKNGFEFEVFLVMVGVALGSKVTDAFSRKIDPSIQPPK